MHTSMGRWSSPVEGGVCSSGVVQGPHSCLLSSTPLVIVSASDFVLLPLLGHKTRQSVPVTWTLISTDRGQVRDTRNGLEWTQGREGLGGSTANSDVVQLTKFSTNGSGPRWGHLPVVEKPSVLARSRSSKQAC